jgi:hypothetical protein
MSMEGKQNPYSLFKSKMARKGAADSINNTAGQNQQSQV